MATKLKTKDNKRQTLPDEFGKKIGGSKRDQWRERGLMLSDLDEMNDAEKDKFIKKANIWKTPDYTTMYRSGRYDREVLYFIKKVKDKAAASPRHKTTETFDAGSEYVKEMTAFRDKVMSITTWAQCQDLLSWIEQTGRLTGCTVSEEFGNIGGADIVNAIYRMPLSRVRSEIVKKSFLYSDEEIFARRFYIYRKASGECEELKPGYCMMPVAGGKVGVGMKLDKLNKVPAGDCILMGYDRKVISTGSEKELKDVIHGLYTADKALKAAADTKETDISAPKKGKKKFKIPVSVAHCTRTLDGRDISIKEDITPDQMLSAFNFYGGEFGNWLNDETRQTNLTKAYEAFEDLAKALGIPAKEISFDNRLSIAFGARGSGNAAAHYEPMREVINLTKFSGAGCLAHEYGHALDDILAKKAGLKKPFSESTGKDISPAMKKLLSVMKYKKSTVTETAEQRKKKFERASKNLCRCFKEEFTRLNEDGRKAVNDWYAANIISVTADMVGSRDCTWDYAVKLLPQLEALKKQVNPRSRKLRNDFINQFKVYASQYFDTKLFADKPKEVRVYTDLYKGSIKFDETFQRDSHGYWQSDIEMFARCFSCYIEDKLTDMGIRNDYLAGSSDCFTLSIGDETYRAYPVGEERKTIDAAMEDFLKEVLSGSSDKKIAA